MCSDQNTKYVGFPCLTVCYQITTLNNMSTNYLLWKQKLKDALAMYYIQQLDIHQRYNRSMKIEELQTLMILVISDVCFSITHHETHSTFFIYFVYKIIFFVIL